MFFKGDNSSTVRNAYNSLNELIYCMTVDGDMGRVDCDWLLKEVRKQSINCKLPFVGI